MKTYIAIDLGGTNLRVGLVNENLEVVTMLRELSIHNDEDALGEQIVRMIGEILKLHRGNEKIKYVGISAAGFFENNILKFSPNLQIRDFDIIKVIKDAYPEFTVEAENDASASALVEAKFGAAKGCKDVFFITISSGIGYGLVANGKLVNLPFEGGHNYVGYQGRFYEFEQICSGNGLVLLAKLNGLEVASSREFFAIVASGDRLAHKIYDDWLNLVGAQIANAQLLFNPEAVVLSGGVMNSSSLFFEDLKSVSNAFTAPFPVRKINLVQSIFKDDTGLLGGAALAASLDK